MDEITLVRDTLRSHGKWHGGRLSLVSMLLMPYYGPELSTGVSGRLWKGAEGVPLSTSATLLSANMDEIATLGHFPEPSPASLTGAHPLAVW